MSCNLRSRIRSYLRSSLWIIPVFAGLAERIFRALVQVIEAHTNWAWFDLGIEGARALCSTVITLSLSFVVFLLSALAGLGEQTAGENAQCECEYCILHLKLIPPLRSVLCGADLGSIHSGRQLSARLWFKGNTFQYYGYDRKAVSAALFAVFDTLNPVLLA